MCMWCIYRICRDKPTSTIHLPQVQTANQRKQYSHIKGFCQNFINHNSVYAHWRKEREREKKKDEQKISMHETQTEVVSEMRQSERNKIQRNNKIKLQRRTCAQRKKEKNIQTYKTDEKKTSESQISYFTSKLVLCFYWIRWQIYMH